jgi:hypothetical protein
MTTRPLGETAAEMAGNIWRGYSTRDRTLLAIGSIICWLLFATMGKLFGIPPVAGYQASLLTSGSAILSVLLSGVMFVACVLIGSLIAGAVHFEGGMFCASVGMLSLSTRGGPMRYVLMYAGGAGVYAALLLELLLLAVIVGIGWNVLLGLRNAGYLHAEPLRDDDPDALPAQGAMALVGQVILMIFLMALMAQSDRKAQVIWSVAISSSLAAFAAHSLFPARPSAWFWSAPLIVGGLGYTLAWFGGPPGAGGTIGGLLPALARPLPLDYAGAGVAGALYGYWTSRKWLHEHEDEPHTTGEVEEAVEQTP